jgi:8-oxo-dGTP pyrophosphatase MutT (NUDIX family)
MSENTNSNNSSGPNLPLTKNPDKVDKLPVERAFEKPAVTISKKFNLRHVFRSGGIVWVKSKGKDYYLVFKSLSRPSRGIQIPGGRIEKFENPADTIIRETQEETGIECRLICPLGLVLAENSKDLYSNLQLFYILKPVFNIDIHERWRFIDRDNTRQELECWFVPVDKDPSFLAVGQDMVIDMFRKWLSDNSKAKEDSRLKGLNMN